MPKVTIVISTHHRNDLLKLAIKSLCNQTAPKEIFEVIVVDNVVLPEKEVKAVVEEARAKINISYLYEPVIGLSQARNTGGKAGSADYIGYMDDDAKASENYLEVLAKLLENIKYDLIGGPYYAYYLTQKPNWFRDKYESSTSGLSHFFNENELLNGTNLIIKKSLLEEAGWFNTSFGMTGKDIAYGEETELQKRLWKKKNDLMVFYSEDLIVYHLVPAHKMKIMDKFQRSYNMGKSQAYLWIAADKIKSTQKKSPITLIKTIGFLIFKGIPGLFFRNRKMFPFWQNYAYEVFSKYFASIGQEWRYFLDLLRPRSH